MVNGKNQQEAAPQAFLSYAHHDDKFLGGGIQHLREDLEDAIRFVTGEPFKIFLDKDGIELGQHWPSRLSERIKSARFFIPILSPNYFHSDSCKKEALEFLKYEENLGRNDLILPIYLVDTPFVDDVDTINSDILAKNLNDRQHRDCRSLVFEERASANRSLFIKELASEIDRVNNRVGSFEGGIADSNLADSSNDEFFDPSIVEQALTETEVLITLSRRRIVVGQNAVDTMMQFWFFLKNLYASRQQNDESLFVWIVDIGSRLAEEPFSFDEYFNAGLLALQLQTFSQFDSRNDYDEDRRSRLYSKLHSAHPIHRNRRWKWLIERSVVVVQNLRPEEYQDLCPNTVLSRQKSGLRVTGTSAEQLLLTKTPIEWEEELVRLYGRKIDAADATFTVFLSKNDENNNDHSLKLRYFAHAAMPAQYQQPVPRSSGIGGTTQSAELTSPGQNYDDAFQLMRAAAYSRLKIENDTTEDEGLAALAYIEKLGFQVLTVPDFLHSISRLFEFDDSSADE